MTICQLLSHYKPNLSTSKGQHNMETHMQFLVFNSFYKYLKDQNQQSLNSFCNLVIGFRVLDPDGQHQFYGYTRFHQ